MWLYENKEFVSDDNIEKYAGFVYCITNIITGKRYIGKKLFKNTRRIKVKNKARRKTTVKESDWKDYWGSNNLLQEDVKILGESNFKREILRLCYTKGECNYWEAKYQMQYGVLESEEWYNDHIWVRVHRKHLGVNKS